MSEGLGLFDRIRSACREVTRRARFVRIDAEALAAFAVRLARAPSSQDDLDPGHHFRGSVADRLCFTIALDAINFGSGWFPYLRKQRGQSGYFTIAGGLRHRFERDGPLSPYRLAKARPEQCAEIFGQDLSTPEQAELMTHFARAWRDLGELLLDCYGGDFAQLIGAAGGSAETLVELLAAMPLYRDVSRYDELEVPLFKRAQITAADLALAFEGRGPGTFRDLDELTIFADNLVPHVLRVEGVLRYDADLSSRIDAGILIAPGSPEEVELRACALHAVEGMCDLLRRSGHPATAHRLDHVLWNRGHSAQMKALPRHRARSVYY